MNGAYSRCLYAVWSNPATGVSPERFREYYEEVHRPDTLAIGHFDRSYRYEALGECHARYLTLWEAEYADPRSALDQVRKGARLLQQQGRIWPVQEVVFHQFGFAPTRALPPDRRVTTLTTAQNDWRTPARDLDAEAWARDALPGTVELAGSYSARFLYAGGARFLWLGESDSAPEALDALWRGCSTNLPPLGAPTPIFKPPLFSRKPRDPAPSADPALRNAAWVVHWKPI